MKDSIIVLDRIDETPATPKTGDKLADAQAAAWARKAFTMAPNISRVSVDDVVRDAAERAVTAPQAPAPAPLRAGEDRVAAAEARARETSASQFTMVPNVKRG